MVTEEIQSDHVLEAFNNNRKFYAPLFNLPLINMPMHALRNANVVINIGPEGQIMKVRVEQVAFHYGKIM